VMILNLVLFLILPAALHLIGYAKRWELSPEESLAKSAAKGSLQNQSGSNESFSERFWGSCSHGDCSRVRPREFGGQYFVGQ
jgi:hypothetical protein